MVGKVWACAARRSRVQSRPRCGAARRPRRAAHSLRQCPSPSSGCPASHRTARARTSYRYAPPRTRPRRRRTAPRDDRRSRERSEVVRTRRRRTGGGAAHRLGNDAATRSAPISRMRCSSTAPEHTTHDASPPPSTRSGMPTAPECDARPRSIAKERRVVRTSRSAESAEQRVPVISGRERNECRASRTPALHPILPRELERGVSTASRPAAAGHGLIEIARTQGRELTGDPPPRAPW